MTALKNMSYASSIKNFVKDRDASAALCMKQNPYISNKPFWPAFLFKLKGLSRTTSTSLDAILLDLEFDCGNYQVLTLQVCNKKNK